MYHRVSGAVFTVRDNEEKKQIVETINSTKPFCDTFKCLGLAVEQFTGKIKTATVKMKETGKVMSLMVSGTFPVMVLSFPELSNNTYTIEFTLPEGGVVKKVEEPICIPSVFEVKTEEKDIKEEVKEIPTGSKYVIKVEHVEDGIECEDAIAPSEVVEIIKKEQQTEEKPMVISTSRRKKRN